MEKVLHNWWGWLLCIIVIRLVFIGFGDGTLQPDETAIQILIEKTYNDSEPSIRDASAKALYESVLVFPQHRDLIMNKLAELSKKSANNSEVIQLVKKIESDPLYQLTLAVEKPNLPLTFYLEPLLYAVPIICGIIFVLFFPFFIAYVVGHRATIKLYGRRGKPLMYFMFVVSWCTLFTTSIFYPQWFIISHITLITLSMVVLFLVVYKKMLTLFLDIRQQKCWGIFGLFLCLSLISFLPYTNAVSNLPQVKVSQDKVLKAIESLEEKHYTKAKPLLVKILYNKIYNQPLILQKSLYVLGQIGDSNSLRVVNGYLRHINAEVRKTAIEATSKIIKKMSK
ncbi:HEAT repeat domain-containing protein [Candidatus Uabimicrobium sp. HlEnr_7]|uniref:HEAT repeat domain-containing protein n=1 Tax=Candidatus Uabimicrobium helgolandensis TaxID=3095367 RepID=UPI003558AEE0